ncbi:oxygen-binding di-iron domain-containing protein [Hydrogenimonas cancrithermarum]|uniref:diguanylate cyclase n=1 Tax=Hydrogenimonas cancrithermarum TaxID=2993563 RepID=A0ABN6WWQ6_9BACT|nr:diguanylate cyclase [Hydrogenimonas cancrithermarum]BDY13625.1 hypothetical protein HCR_19370 [Hydrogenimonas cancrithermarum]
MKVSPSISPFNHENDLTGPIEISPQIWWVGHLLENDPFQCHVYLIENGDRSILIDPGSKLTWPHSREKIRRILPLEHIKYIVCQHPDPDITSGIEDLLAEIGTEGRQLVTHWRSAELLEHYDWGLDFYEVQAENWELVAGDRRIKFIFTPYMHFPGAICTYDVQTEILFSSDIFGAVTENFSLFATDEKSYFQAMIPFHTHYMPATEIVNHGLDNIEKYPLSLIAPQHGSIIKKAFIPFLIKELRNLKCGIYLEYGGTRKIELISKINAIMPEVFEAAAFFDSFHRDTQHILKIMQKVFPISRILALVLIDNSYFIKLDSDNDTVVPCNRRKEDILNKFSETFYKQKRLVMGSEIIECIRFDTPKKLYLFPIRNYKKKVTGIGMFALDPAFETSEEILNMLRKFEIAVDVIAKREVEVYRLENEKKKVYTMAITDQLTGLYNRYYLEETGEAELARAKRHAYPVAVLYLDIDYFKKINDRYGHDIGDRILKHFATLISGHLRKGDLAFRLGGEEFMVLMPYTNRSDALKIAKRLQAIVKERGVIDTAEGEVSFTFSGGVTDTDECGYDLQTMLKRADEKLYAAKAAGRNRIVA